jgi:hypothetical protein
MAGQSKEHKGRHRHHTYLKFEMMDDYQFYPRSLGIWVRWLVLGSNERTSAWVYMYREGEWVYGWSIKVKEGSPSPSYIPNNSKCWMIVNSVPRSLCKRVQRLVGSNKRTSAWFYMYREGKWVHGWSIKGTEGSPSPSYIPNNSKWWMIVNSIQEVYIEKASEYMVGQSMEQKGRHHHHTYLKIEMLDDYQFYPRSLGKWVRWLVASSQQWTYISMSLYV